MSNSRHTIGWYLSIILRLVIRFCINSNNKFEFYWPENTRVVPKLALALSRWTCNTIYRILSKRTYYVVYYLSNKHSQTSVCQIDLKLQLVCVFWKQLCVPLRRMTGARKSGQKIWEGHLIFGSIGSVRGKVSASFMIKKKKYLASEWVEIM